MGGTHAELRRQSYIMVNQSTMEQKTRNTSFLYRLLLFAGLVAVVVYFLPRERKFNYQFEVNKPWLYGLLQAPYDFPIYKSDEVFARERDSVMASYAPYYDIDKSVFLRVMNKFEDDYRKQYSKVISPACYNYIVDRLTEIYKVGILSSDEVQRLSTEKVHGIHTVTGNISKGHALADVFTSKRAYQYLADGDSSRVNKEELQQCNLHIYIEPNLIYNAHRSQADKEETLSAVSYAVGFVITGQRIIDRGEIVTPKTFAILSSLEKEWDKRGDNAGGWMYHFVGQVIFVVCIVFLLYCFLAIFRMEYLVDRRSLYLILSTLVVFPVITSLMVSNAFLIVYVLPFAMVTLILKVFLDSYTAFMVHSASMMLCSISLKTPYEFLLLQLIAGLVAVYSFKELSQRSQLFRAAFFVTLGYSVMYLALELTHVDDVSQLTWYMYVAFFISGVLLLFMYPLLLILEKAFGFTSNVTLIELSNINNKLLSDLSEKAPGTFQHSMQVANLAAAAAVRIKGKVQLVRTGAMYHDIGKMLNPAFFTENQTGFNPHTRIDYMQSAQIVIAHVTDGMKLAEQHNLPRSVRDFICTHHGKGLTKYFYVSYQNEHPDEEVDAELFRYPGPNPNTKEQAIMMMADAVEAASRSLDEYTEEKIQALVHRLIDAQMQEGFFAECPITFREIEEVKKVFVEKLKIIYHTRISYPELKK